MPEWQAAVAATHASGAGEWADGRVTVSRVAGGFNNALYRVQAGDQTYACKLCVADERRRAAREYGALRLLHTAGLDIAPTPLWLDESCHVLPLPAVAYAWLAGASLGASLTSEQVESLLDSYHRLHSVRPGDGQQFDLPDAWFHWFHFAPYLSELSGFLDHYGSWLATTGPEGRELRDRLASLVDDVADGLMTAGVDPGRASVALRLCRVDPNVANTVWGADGRLRWVDWEYSGWGDPALDLAELRWHAALLGLSEEQHGWLRRCYRRPPEDNSFDERLALWDRLLATRWPFLILRWLWSVFRGPDRERLTRPSADPAELRARLVYFVERAEHQARSAQ